MTDSNACNATSKVSHTISYSNLRVTAGFTVNDTVCQGSDALFSSTSANGSNFHYLFGDGAGASSANATHTYNDTGRYTITLVVNNPGACNGVDTFRHSVYVTVGPVADFAYAPVVPVTNTPTVFTNLSLRAVRYSWDFGDSSTSTEPNPSHLYKRTGQYNVCLTAYNRLSCPAKICKSASSDILPLADIPTAFSPNGDGSNDILFVRGAAIQTIDLKIFNRWGQLVFQTNDQTKGWDGTYNGKPQEMDAYAYVLKVLFVDGTSLQKKGNVTLLR